jgi:hypothetical protein
VMLSAKIGLTGEEGSSANCGTCRIVGQAPDSTRLSDATTESQSGQLVLVLQHLHRSLSQVVKAKWMTPKTISLRMQDSLTSFAALC